MGDLRYDNRVAVITGGGRGLGRAYALLLASRGAKIVVNDPGFAPNGDGTTAHPAEELVQEIKSAGGEAVANTDSVATPEGGKAIIDTAINSFGRVDILIHNAGNTRRSPIAEMSDADFNSVLDTHLRGGFYVARAAMGHMLAAGYGRIVLTSSIAGVYGDLKVPNYSAAKSGLLGLSNAIALNGRDANVKCNALIPAAVTRLSEGLDISQFPPMEPEKVAPLVAWLVHDSCPVSGEMYVSAAGRMARAYVVETQGVYDGDWTIEKIAANIDAIRNSEKPEVFPILPGGYGQHLGYSFAMAREGMAKAKN